MAVGEAERSRPPAPRRAVVDVATVARWEGERQRPHALHSDGAVCRCAVRWRVLTLERGLNRPELWSTVSGA
jgi:hypothetical protein